MTTKNKTSQPTEHNITAKPFLTSGIGYQLGDYRLTLLDDGTLKVMVNSSNHHLGIAVKPKADNCVLLFPCK